MADPAAARRRLQVPEPRRDDLIAEVATLYYRSRLDQEEIARRVGVSRSTVSRMLSEALDRRRSDPDPWRAAARRGSAA